MTKNLIQKNVDLSPYNTFGICANAAYFAVLKAISDLQTLLNDPLWSVTPRYILGGGSNILFTQDYPGLLIKNEIKGIEAIDQNEDSITLKVGSGENWHDLVVYTVDQGWGGLENLALIPGTVGAAPIQNIGAYGVELCSSFHSLHAINLNNGSLQNFTKAECNFGYRDSIFKACYKNQYVITHVMLELRKKPLFNIDYSVLKQTLQAMQIKELSLKAVRDAVISIRTSKLPDPKIIGNAGSFFKNPVISISHYTELKKHFSDIPGFVNENEDSVKVPAAWLIEQCGWKGKREGDIGVYHKQALVIVNYGTGTGEQVLALAQKIQQSVERQFGIVLSPEVNII